MSVVWIRPTHSPPYPVYLEGDYSLADRLGSLNASSVFVISQEGLEECVISPFLTAAFPGPSPRDILLLKQGEEEKHFRNLEHTYNRLLEKGLDRKSVIVALGGGVVGDFAGFVASTLLRGVRFVQVPTTLLAAVDSSVGGKVAVNVNYGKNMVGAFYHPNFVWFNTASLDTLPEKEWVCGLAEMAKHACLAAPPETEGSVFDLLCKHAARIRSPVSPEFQQAVTQSIAVKAAVVGADEKEEGLRAVLNLGHTTAHAIETFTGLRAFSHGEAVSRGLATALFLSKRLTALPESDFERMMGLFEALHLPMDTAGLAADDLLSQMKYDKKSERGSPRFVLLQGIGRPKYGCPVEAADFRAAWADQTRRFG